eukprot:11680910-Alexandrium_andersonii.AAC.1
MLRSDPPRRVHAPPDLALRVVAQQRDQLRAHLAHVDHSAVIRAHGSLSAAHPEETVRIVGAAPTELNPMPEPEVPSLGLCCSAGAAGSPGHHS